jgi:hypothetical protein
MVAQLTDVPAQGKWLLLALGHDLGWTNFTLWDYQGS